jgi:hypothetical protein
MKKPTIFITLFLFAISSFGQQSTATSAPKPNTDYIKKSKNQKTAAWIMLGSGAALVITGIIIPKGESKGFTGSYYGLPAEEYENDGIKAAVGGIGLLFMLGSIPFFIASGKNKRRATSLSFNNMKTLQIKNSSFVYQPIPAVSLKINL